MGDARYALTVLGLLVWPAALTALIVLVGFSLWLVIAMHLFGVQWELVLTLLVSMTLVVALARATESLLRSARRRLIRVHAQLVAGACAVASIGITVYSRQTDVDRFSWGNVGLLCAAWAIVILFAARKRS